MSSAEDYYTILGVPRNAARSEIKSAFKKLAMIYHPDVSKDPAAHVSRCSFAILDDIPCPRPKLTASRGSTTTCAPGSDSLAPRHTRNGSTKDRCPATPREHASNTERRRRRPRRMTNSSSLSFRSAVLRAKLHNVKWYGAK
jgi:hypothetical protein